jgi:hypothetical protein
MQPGMKHRSDPLIGQTIVLPARFGSVITASSGTSIHSLSIRTRKLPSFDSQAGRQSQDRQQPNNMDTGLDGADQQRDLDQPGPHVAGRIRRAHWFPIAMDGRSRRSTGSR